MVELAICKPAKDNSFSELDLVMRSRSRGTHRGPERSGSTQRSDMLVQADFPRREGTHVAGKGADHILSPRIHSRARKNCRIWAMLDCRLLAMNGNEHEQEEESP